MVKGLCSKCRNILTSENSIPSVFKQGSGWCRACRSERDIKRHADPVLREEKARKRREAWKAMPKEQKDVRLAIARERDKKRYSELTPEKKKRRVRQSVISTRRRATGVNEESFKNRLIEQNGLCAICNKIMTRPCQDHNHETKKSRDLLCHKCNVILGLSFENIEILANAIKYLQKHAGDSSTQIACEDSQNKNSTIS
jgi:hypothetical protein